MTGHESESASVASGPLGVPTAGPPAAVSGVGNAPVAGQPGRFAAATDSPEMPPRSSAHPRGRGPGRPGLNALAERLSGRDEAVLRDLRRSRFLTTQHIERLHAASFRTPTTAARATRKQLRRLHDLQLLQALPRRVGGIHGGAAQTVWQLSSTGLRLLGLLDGAGDTWRVHEVGQAFVAHHLAIADTHLALIEAARGGAFELLDVQLEPDCWRSFLDSSGVAQVLKPDLSVVTATGDFEDHWFIEVDRGTESIPTLLRQCQAYARYRRSGIEQQAVDVFPRIIWLLPTERRRDRLLDAIGNARGLERGLFYALLTPDQLTDFIRGGVA